MLKLNKHITLDSSAIKSTNLSSRFDPDDLKRIGAECALGYRADLESRRTWMKRNEAGMDLAMQIVKEKSFPWVNCSAVAFPLVTVASQQFHARAYPAIVSGSNLVKYRVVGDDPTGERASLAAKISRHMSYQLLEEDQPWEEQTDRLLLNLSIIGTTFKKSYYSSSLGHLVSEMVMAKDLVINYWAKSVEDCPRKTHVVPLMKNEIHEKVLRGTFNDVLNEPWYNSLPATPTRTAQAQKEDNRQGVNPPTADETTPFQCLEQHVSLDLDGDGYAEPYIITFEEHSEQVLRIVLRFDDEKAVERVESGKYRGKIVRINATEYFTKFSFIPSPDGGIYDIGFGVFLGPLNESVNTLVNQLIDAGTLSTTAGGFLGRGAKLRGGVYQFSPFGWNRVDSTGDDLQKSIFPLPVREPSLVLFQLLSLLIQYTNRIAGTTETMVGENPGQNTPAYNMQSMVEMGQKIYSAIFKRVWRSSKEEFKKLFKLNGMYLPVQGPMANREDYLGNADYIIPAADPAMTSDQARLTQAITLKQSAATSPGYNVEAVERKFLQALQVDNIDQIYPGPSKMPPPAPDIRLQIEDKRLEAKRNALELDKLKFITSMQEEQRLNNAKILELTAKAALEIENAGGVEEGRKIAAFEASIGALKVHSDHLNKQIELMMKGREDETNGGRMEGMAAAPSDISPTELGQVGAPGVNGALG